MKLKVYKYFVLEDTTYVLPLDKETWQEAHSHARSVISEAVGHLNTLEHMNHDEGHIGEYKIEAERIIEAAEVLNYIMERYVG